MTGETYIAEYIRITEREKALQTLEHMKKLEKENQKLYNKRKKKRKITYDPIQNTTRIHYYV